MKKIKKAKWFTFSSILMLSSSFTTIWQAKRVMNNYRPDSYASTEITINNQKIDYDKFCDGLISENGIWYYQDTKGQRLNLFDATDYRVMANLAHNSFQGVKSQLNIDSVEIKRNAKSQRIYFSMGSLDSLSNLPSMGNHNWGKITIRHFWSKDSTLAQKYKIYNDDYNCTYRHEYQHYLNMKAGSQKGGQSYERMFAKACMDEVSANIAQLRQQCMNYFETGDINHITDRFDFYRKRLLDPNNPVTKDNLDDKFLALGVLEAWKKDKFKIYEERNFSNMKYRLSKMDYNGCINHDEDHEQIMQAMFTIDGIDYWQYLRGHDNDFIEMLSPELKKEAQALTAAKKAKMEYLQKIGQYTDNDVSQKRQLFKNIKEKRLFDKSYLGKKLAQR